MSRTIFPMMIKALVLCSVKFCKFLVFLGMNFRQSVENSQLMWVMSVMHLVEKAFKQHVCDGDKKLKINKLRVSRLTQMFLRTNRQHQAAVIWCNIDPDPAPGWESSVTVQWTGWWLLQLLLWVTLMLFNPMLNRKLGLLCQFNYSCWD